MENKEFNLSKRILDCYDTEKLEVDDVKEFIKILRSDFCNCGQEGNDRCWNCKRIDRRVGNELGG